MRVEIRGGGGEGYFSPGFVGWVLVFMLFLFVMGAGGVAGQGRAEEI